MTNWMNMKYLQITFPGQHVVGLIMVLNAQKKNINMAIWILWCKAIELPAFKDVEAQ